MNRNIPNVLVIGFPKCGTTSMYDVFLQHPDLYLSSIKEPLYYCVPNFYKKGFSWYLDRYYKKAPVDKTIVEVNPTLVKNDFSQQIVNDYGENIKIIIVLRDPINRLYSDFKMNMLFGCVFDEQYSLDVPSSELFDSWINSIYGYSSNDKTVNCDILRYCSYANQINTYKTLVPDHNLKFVLFEELVENPQKVYKELFNFIGVEENVKISFNIHSNQGNYAPKSWKNIKFIRFWNATIWRKLILNKIPYGSDKLSRLLNDLTWEIPFAFSKKQKSDKISNYAKEVLSNELYSEYKYVLDIIDKRVNEYWVNFSN